MVKALEKVQKMKHSIPMNGSITIHDMLEELTAENRNTFSFFTIFPIRVVAKGGIPIVWFCCIRFLCKPVILLSFLFLFIPNSWDVNLNNTSINVLVEFL